MAAPEPSAVAGRLRDCRGFTTFWTAATVSGFGTYVTALAVQVLVVVTLHGDASDVGLVSAARWLPYLLLGLVAGVLVDRSRRLPVLVSTDLIRGVLLFAVPALAVTHRLTFPVLVVFMVVFGLMSLLNDAAAQSFVPYLVPRALLMPANARLDQSDAVAQTSGPALAGALVALLTAPWAVLVDAVSYLVSGIVLLRIRVEEATARRASLRAIPGEAMEGLRWVYRHRMLRPYALSTHAWFVCSSIAGAVLPPFALRTLRLSAFEYGVALAVAGVGGLLGALAATRLGSRHGVGRVVVAGTAGCGLAWAIVAASPASGVLVLCAGELLLGVSMGVMNANEMGYKQAVTPGPLLARSNATMRSLNRAMVVIGAPLGGVLGDAIGLRTMIWVAATGFVVVAAALSSSPYRHARIDLG